MSPKEQATAVKLLAEWLRISGADAEKPPLNQVAELVFKLREQTQAFIDHENDE